MKNIISQTGTPTQNFPLWYSTPYYLLIEGGTGHGKPYQGGTHKFTGTYLNPEQEKYRIHFKNMKSCLSAFCQKSGVKFWHANSLEELIEQMKDLTVEDISTINSKEWIEFKTKEDSFIKRNLEGEIKIANSYISEIPNRKRAIRKDGNLRADLQKEMDNYRFRKEQAERELRIYQPKLV